jgi:116 kDa U5 small nuclear ribonucleoprotein component
MTEDILFDNIYVGHSLEEATALAAESFDIKRPIEEAESAISDNSSTESKDSEEKKSFKEDPLSFLRSKIEAFIASAKVDPVAAIKSQPETAGALVVGVVTLLGMLGTLFGVVGGAQKPVTKVNPCAIQSLPSA